MKDNWEERISRATNCARCNKKLDIKDQRILSVYDDQAICMECKKKEEERPDYEEVSKSMIGQCVADVDQQWGDPGAYCYHHFYPYKC
jgi:hypothetical protein